MVKTLQIDNKDFDVSKLSDAGRKILSNYMYVVKQLQAAENMHAVLIKARNAYMADIKNEMIQGKSGVDLAALFGD